MKNVFCFIILGILSAFCLAQSSNISGIINTYSNVSAISGDTITVVSSSAFSVGDKLLIIQMQGATINETNTSNFGDITNMNGAGNYEFNTICEIPSSTEIIVNEIQQTYNPTGMVQVVYVPVYNDAIITASLTAAAWNGLTGGILAFECLGTLTMNNGIDLEGVGFRGGSITNSNYSCSWLVNEADYHYNIFTGQGAMKGEGVALYINGKTGGRGAQANGGGGGNDHNSGGGGGANGSFGGLGGERIKAGTFNCQGLATGEGGKLNTYSNAINKVFLGGGGGAGHENNSNTGTAGANGGGIVFISANTINGNGNAINTNGALVSGNSGDGAGGGGAGGSVLLNVSNYIGSLIINANGSNGGNVSNIGPSNCNGPGGGGSGGVLWVNQSSVSANISLNNSGGSAGTTIATTQGNCTLNGTNNATAGSNGIILTNLSWIEAACNIPLTNLSTIICNSDSALFGGIWQFSSGVFYDTITVGCCDSIIETILTVLPALTSTINQTICSGDSIVVNGTTYNSSVTSATEVFNSIGPNNCDSTVTINLTVLNPLTGTINKTICAGDSIVVNGTTYNSSVTGAVEVFNNIGLNNCDSTVTINLTVLNAIDTSINLSGGTISANQTGATFQWLDCNNGNSPIPAATSANYVANSNGNYSVAITVGSCSDTSSCVNISTVDIIKNDFDNKLIIYPNPTNGYFYIDLGENQKNATITITNLLGKLILSKTYIDSQLLDIKLEEPTGVYILTVESGKKEAIIRLVIK